MKTKDKILHKSLEMFNAQGIPEVSLRDIAKQINISVGNLNYHFPTTNDIINELSLRLIDDINMSIAKLMEKPASDPLASLYHTIKTIFTSQLKYKFLFNGRYAEIVTSIPKMQNYYQEAFESHFNMGSQIFGQLAKEGYIKKELISDMNGFLYMSNMLNIYWQQEISIFQPQLSDAKKIQQALAVSFQAYKPYLTKKGTASLIPLLKELKHYKKDGN